MSDSTLYPQPDVPQNEGEVTAPTFEDLTLGEAVAQFLRDPLRTFAALRTALSTPPEQRSALILTPTVSRASVDPFWTRLIERFQALLLPILMTTIVVIALFISITFGSREVRLSTTIPVGIGVMLAMGLIFGIMASQSLGLVRLPTLTFSLLHPKRVANAEEMLTIYGIRIGAAGTALATTLGTWTFTRDNQLTPLGLVLWGGSIVLWLFVLYDRREEPFKHLFQGLRDLVARARQPFHLRLSWLSAALIAILLVGAMFRFNGLSQYPPDMTSDHVEKALDAMKIANGLTPVFFPNNGGRESFQMYLIAFAQRVTGLPFGFDLLKLVTGLEGMLVILAAFWLGRVFIGEEDRHLGNLTGLIMAAMVAMSYWHTILSRLGLRIVLTTLGVTLLLIFLTRAVRYNRRMDYLLAGLMLGFGMYWYQAMRMTPLLVIAAALLMVVIRVRSLRALAGTIFNFGALVLLSVVIFVPSARYWEQYPEYFWQRTEGRLFGDSIIQVKNELGQIIGYRQASIEDRIAAFSENLPLLNESMRRALMMFNVSGDRAWVTGDPDGTPELDILAGSFLLMGFGVLVVRGLRQHDPADWLMVLGLFIMLLPTALSIAFMVEIPSATRASGALPIAYLMAALGMAVLLKAFLNQLQSVRTRRLVYIVAVAALLMAGVGNAHAYFEEAMKDYRTSTFPYAEAGRLLRGFSQSTGSVGNAFMIAWDYWWDYRAIGMEAGEPLWGNGVLRDDLRSRLLEKMSYNLGTKYEIRPDRQMMFFLHQSDTDSLSLLEEMFPGGEVIDYPSFRLGREFRVYVAPPVGCEWVEQNLDAVVDACLK